MGRWVGDCLGKQSRGMRGGIGESKIAFRSECFDRSYRWQHGRTCRAGGRYLFASARRKDASRQPLALPHRSGQTDQMLVFAQRCRPARGRSRRRRCGRYGGKARPGGSAQARARHCRFRAASTQTASGGPRRGGSKVGASWRAAFSASREPAAGRSVQQPAGTADARGHAMARAATAAARRNRQCRLARSTLRSIAWGRERAARSDDSECTSGAAGGRPRHGQHQRQRR